MVQSAKDAEINTITLTGALYTWDRWYDSVHSVHRSWLSDDIYMMKKNVYLNNENTQSNLTHF